MGDKGGEEDEDLKERCLLQNVIDAEEYPFGVAVGLPIPEDGEFVHDDVFQEEFPRVPDTIVLERQDTASDLSTLVFSRNEITPFVILGELVATPSQQFLHSDNHNPDVTSSNEEFRGMRASVTTAVPAVVATAIGRRRVPYATLLWLLGCLAVLVIALAVVVIVVLVAGMQGSQTLRAAQPEEVRRTAAPSLSQSTVRPSMPVAPVPTNAPIPQTTTPVAAGYGGDDSMSPSFTHDGQEESSSAEPSSRPTYVMDFRLPTISPFAPPVMSLKPSAHQYGFATPSEQPQQDPEYHSGLPSLDTHGHVDSSDSPSDVPSEKPTRGLDSKMPVIDTGSSESPSTSVPSQSISPTTLISASPASGHTSTAPSETMHPSPGAPRSPQPSHRTSTPTESPSSNPSTEDTPFGTVEPTYLRGAAPTGSPSTHLSLKPTLKPSRRWSPSPTRIPTNAPTGSHTATPVAFSTEGPTSSQVPTKAPTLMPLGAGGPLLTQMPSAAPSFQTSLVPFASSPSTDHPSARLTVMPTLAGWMTTDTPSSSPSTAASPPTNRPTLYPTVEPSSPPTNLPTLCPTAESSQAPTDSKCFRDRSELNMALSAYMEDSGSDSLVASRYGWPIGHWCVSDIGDFSLLFSGATTFNEDLSIWDVSQSTTLRAMFYGATSFNQDLSSWNVSGVTDMALMFAGATSFNQDLSSWHVSNVVSFERMFDAASSFNQDLAWDTTSARDMKYMFSDAMNFNGDVGSWQVSSVEDMSFMFSGARSFDQDIGSWEVSSVTDMRYMFHSATSFNKGLSEWIVSNVMSMEGMFLGASSFRQNLCSFGDLLPVDAIVTDMFKDSRCRVQRDPVLERLLSPGPFCTFCSLSFEDPFP